MVELRIGNNFDGYFVEAVGLNLNYLFYDGRYRIDDWLKNYYSLGRTECKRQVYYNTKTSAELAITEFRRQERMDELKKVEAEIKRLEALKKKLTQTFKAGQWFKIRGITVILVQIAAAKYKLINVDGNRYSDKEINKSGWDGFTLTELRDTWSALTPINVSITEVD